MLKLVVRGALLVSAMAVATAPALAADLGGSAKDDGVYLSPRFNWAGFYLGLNAGGFWGESKYTHTATGAWVGNPDAAVLHSHGSGTLDPSGFIGGGQGGYNWQMGGVVIGLETDYQGWGLHMRRITAAPTGVAATGVYTENLESDWLFTVRPRAGVAFDGALVYITGGLAVTDRKFAQDVHFNASGSDALGAASTIQAGWTIGGGLEYALTNHWTIKGEYLFVDFPQVTANLFNAAFPTFTHRVTDDFSTSTVRAGINYKF